MKARLIRRMRDKDYRLPQEEWSPRRRCRRQPWRRHAERSEPFNLDSLGRMVVDSL